MAKRNGLNIRADMAPYMAPRHTSPQHSCAFLSAEDFSLQVYLRRPSDLLLQSRTDVYLFALQPFDLRTKSRGISA